jgi:hypothetical protein
MHWSWTTRAEYLADAGSGQLSQTLLRGTSFWLTAITASSTAINSASTSSGISDRCLIVNSSSRFSTHWPSSRAEPKEAGNRLFLNSDFAKAWLRKVPMMDLATRKDGRLNVTDAIERDSAGIPVVIEERDAEHIIIQPQGHALSVLKN